MKTPQAKQNKTTNEIIPPELPKVPLSETHFVITPKIVSFIQFINDHKNVLPVKEQEYVSHIYLPFGHVDSNPIPRSYLTHLLELYKQILSKSKNVITDELFSSSLTFYQLVQGSSVSPQGALPVSYVRHCLKSYEVYNTDERFRTKAFQKYLNEVRSQQDRRDYLSLVSDLPQYQEKISRTFGMSIKGTTKDLSIAANVILIMVTGFVVFWYIGTMVWPSNKVNQLACGIIGVVLALILETFVLVMMSQKEDIYEQKKEQRKMKSIS